MKERLLDSTLAYKPLDFGNGRLTGSVSDQGRLVSLNTVHPIHGYVTLTCVPPFPEGHWYDPAFVRRYRADLARPELPGFGFTFAGTAHYTSTCALIAGALPLVRFTITPGVQVELITFAPLLDGTAPATAVQICTFINEDDETYTLPFRWGGPLALTRSSYAQLTEGGPMARPLDDYHLGAAEGALTLENRGLGWAVAVLGLPAGELRFEQGSAQVRVSCEGTLQLEPGVPKRLVMLFGFGATAAVARQEAEKAARTGSHELLEQTARQWQVVGELAAGAHATETAWHAARAVTYVLACCAAPVTAAAFETTCLITDHQLLPLGWTRDAYYQVQALIRLRRHAAAQGAALAGELDAVLRQHLLWLFEVAERPAGYWGRAYLTNGRCKDHVFQLDQQCYPLLELADYHQLTGDVALLQRLQQKVGSILAMLLDRRAPGAWLFPTSETPADDQVELPYHLSSQIVVWRMLRALGRLKGLLPLPGPDLEQAADDVRRAVYRHMIARHHGEAMFCYLVDLKGNHRLYHDANDLPTALAPAWGFCTSDDPVWRATMAFAFGSENLGGYYDGRFAGLGSVHTPHPWPLGGVQEMIVAGLLGEPSRQRRAWRNLKRSACWDGLFGEAYHELTGHIVSRHWFAWPGAALSLLPVK
jgi:uncharacterized protein